MSGVPIVLFAALLGVTTQDSPSVTKCLGAARSVALSLRTDAAEVNRTAGAPLTPAQRKRFTGDISNAEETIRELWEMDTIASSPQSTVIMQIAPLLRDLARNVEGMLGHLRVRPDDQRREALRDYLAGHEEIASRLASLIAETIDNAGRTPTAPPPDERE